MELIISIYNQAPVYYVTTPCSVCTGSGSTWTLRFPVIGRLVALRPRYTILKTLCNLRYFQRCTFPPNRLLIEHVVQHSCYTMDGEKLQGNGKLFFKGNDVPMSSTWNLQQQQQQHRLAPRQRSLVLMLRSRTQGGGVLEWWGGGFYSRTAPFQVEPLLLHRVTNTQTHLHINTPIDTHKNTHKQNYLAFIRFGFFLFGWSSFSWSSRLVCGLKKGKSHWSFHFTHSRGRSVWW